MTAQELRLIITKLDAMRNSKAMDPYIQDEIALIHAIYTLKAILSEMGG